MRTTSAVLAIVLVVGACAPLHPPEAPIPRSRPQPSAERAIDSTRRAFTQAVARGDWDGVAGMFSDHAIIITPLLDTLRGRAAIVQYLSSASPSPLAALFHFGQFSRDRYLVTCTDGAFERGRYAAVRNERPDTMKGRFAIRWEWDARGVAHVKRITFDSMMAVALPGRADCYPLTVFQHESRRFAVALFGVWAGTAGNEASTIETEMRGQGWARSNQYVCPSWSTMCSYHATPWSNPAGPADLAPVFGTLRYRVSPRIGTELIVGLSRDSGSTLGLDTSNVSSQVEIGWSGSFVGAAVTYQWKDIELGFGPAIDHTRWHMVHENPFNTNLRSEANSSVTPVGFILELGYRVPLASAIMVDLRAQARRFGKTAVPGSYVRVNAADDGTFIGVGVGADF